MKSVIFQKQYLEWCKKFKRLDIGSVYEWLISGGMHDMLLKKQDAPSYTLHNKYNIQQKT
jgi:hypothetical protein